MEIPILWFLKQAAQGEGIRNEKVILDENNLLCFSSSRELFFIAAESQEPLWSGLLGEFYWDQTCRRNCKGYKLTRSKWYHLHIQVQDRMHLLFNEWHVASLPPWVVRTAQDEHKPGCRSVNCGNVISILDVVYTFSHCTACCSLNSAGLFIV